MHRVFRDSERNQLIMTDQITRSRAAERALVLLSVCLAAAAMPLTFTGTAVALPAIGKALGGSPIALNWVTNAFMLTFGSSLMAAGALADAYGRKRVFLIGIGAFAAVSAALAAAPDIVWFDFGRAVQGAAAAAAFSGGMAALAQEFDGASRVRAFSIVGTSFGLGLAFGPIGSGMMIDAFGWRSIFGLVVVLAMLSLLLGAWSLSESRDPQARGLDWPGALSFTAALALLTYGMLLVPERGWTDPSALGLLAGAVAMFVAFGMIERRVARPMLDLTLFRYPRFVGVQLLAAAPAYAFVVLLILLPIRFIGIEGLSEIAAGRLMIALSAPLLILPLVAGLLTRWLTPATICGLGLLVCALGLFWLSRVPVGGDVTVVIMPMVLIGIGISLPWGLMDGLAVSVVPKERAGMATGIFSTTRVAGEGIALAVVGAVLSALTAQHLAADGGAAGQAGPAAQRLVTGNLTGAAEAMPVASRADLIAGYGDAFTMLLLILCAVTVVTAFVVFAFLGWKREPVSEAVEGVEDGAASRA
ncbi:MFS transporter [Bosea sp. 62]|nr:MFS transporter [Bosea sp. 46]CAD5249894.1 MFS transporter [Bosea sp. 21B]CAD5266064.1 MFS transporter [Bosea sp. 7B]VVT44736.1 MFS transporter [Bosea sp. EC-HK365B]VXB04575.1 MFS transporter [Bosea sp. 29B]VXB04640.1 MFS transporter [Bosea sp. 125]VXB85954.1 MFS transporter [Bosea sp. 62]VXC49549.1 MFS transporter [Bosea sp. 127]